MVAEWPLIEEAVGLMRFTAETKPHIVGVFSEVISACVLTH